MDQESDEEEEAHRVRYQAAPAGVQERNISFQ